jgi:mono/diheme cytochrome c family protein
MRTGVTTPFPTFLPRNSWLLGGVLLLGSLGVLPGAEPIDYLRDVKPIFTRKCTSCHGALKQKGQLRLDAASLIRKGGAEGPALVAGKAAESLLIDAVTGANGLERMPLDGEPLSEIEITTLKAWIDQGAPAPEEAIPQDPRQHWAFQKPQRPPVPVASHPEWNGNPIDAFVAAAQTQHGLTPRPLADKRTQLRRVYLDLVGLPPTRAELQEFLRDESPDAYQKTVDRLLASPQYGERWGRHWMDVWRYSDWDGYQAEVRESQPHIWRWRDWIIESLNADKPYDRMLVEMLAADEVAPDDPATLRANGFLGRNWFKFNRNIWLDNTVEHTGKAFLGVTLNCARCHDHMYDPIAQEEYYRFRAFFEPYDVRTDRVPGQPDVAKDGLARVFDAKADTPTFLFHRGDDKQPDKEHPLTPGVPKSLGNPLLDREEVRRRGCEGLFSQCGCRFRLLDGGCGGVLPGSGCICRRMGIGIGLPRMRHIRPATQNGLARDGAHWPISRNSL